MPRLIAEWEAQSAILLTWPHDATLWQSHFTAVQQIFCRITRIITRHQSVWIVCKDKHQREQVSDQLGYTCDNLQYFICNSNDCWSRDYAPISIENKTSIQLLNFSFNGWGHKFPFHLDNQINSRLYRQGVFKPRPMKSINFVLEGGSIDSDGQGTLLTTTRCLLSSSRNRGLNQVAISERFSDWFGTQQIHWLKHGHIIGDDTDGHIDTLARFCNTETIAYSQCKDNHDEHYVPLNKMHDELKRLRQNNQRPYTLIPLPIPKPIFNKDGQRLPATYVNFLITNQHVLVPVYQDNNDAIALERLAQCFPDRTIEPVDSLPLIHQGGSLHCVTMQISASAS